MHRLLGGAPSPTPYMYVDDIEVIVQAIVGSRASKTHLSLQRNSELVNSLPSGKLLQSRLIILLWLLHDSALAHCSYHVGLPSKSLRLRLRRLRIIVF